jgi:hypothetical protein
MNEIFIKGIKNTMSVVEALAESGYSARVELFAKYDHQDSDWEDLLDKDIYSIIYETSNTE